MLVKSYRPLEMKLVLQLSGNVVVDGWISRFLNILQWSMDILSKNYSINKILCQLINCCCSTSYINSIITHLYFLI